MCRGRSCSKKKTCNHYIVNTFLDKLIGEDLSDICLPDYRLYIEGNFYKSFPDKEFYISLLNFYDNECEGENCGKREIYDKNELIRPTRIECKFGEGFTCNHLKHPSNEIVVEFMKILQAEEEAFKKAGINEGTVYYTCPICGGEAVAKRYMQDGSIHGLGSGCKKCETWHT